MKEIPAGFEQHLDLVVGPEMAVEFGHLGAAHQVYATYWMARHFEEVGRMVLLPHLEPHEQGAGTALHVEHLAAAPVGVRVSVVGRHRATTGNRLVVDCEVRLTDGTLAGRGWTEQAVLPADVLDRRLNG